MLQETIASMSPEDANYHMKRCIDSGLWVPNVETENGNPSTEKSSTCEGIYSCSSEN